MSEVTPIKPGVRPDLDIERELIEWATIHIRAHIKQHGEPDAVAIVLLAPDAPNEVNTTSVWSPREKMTGTRIASYAATLLNARALRGMLD